MTPKCRDQKCIYAIILSFSKKYNKTKENKDERC